MNSYLPTMALKTPNLVAATSLGAVMDQKPMVDAVVTAKAAKPRQKRTRVKIGGVYILSDKPSTAQVKVSVTKSAEMLERLGKKIVRPGIKLKAVRDVPLFFADPDHPGRFLRKLNGKIEPGVLDNGAFKVLD